MEEGNRSERQVEVPWGSEQEEVSLVSGMTNSGVWAEIQMLLIILEGSVRESSS